MTSERNCPPVFPVKFGTETWRLYLPHLRESRIIRWNCPLDASVRRVWSVECSGEEFRQLHCETLAVTLWVYLSCPRPVPGNHWSHCSPLARPLLGAWLVNTQWRSDWAGGTVRWWLSQWPFRETWEVGGQQPWGQERWIWLFMCLFLSFIVFVYSSDCRLLCWDCRVFSTDCSAAVFGYTRNHKLPVEEGEEAAWGGIS